LRAPHAAGAEVIHRDVHWFSGAIASYYCDDQGLRPVESGDNLWER